MRRSTRNIPLEDEEELIDPPPPVTSSKATGKRGKRVTALKGKVADSLEELVSVIDTAQVCHTSLWLIWQIMQINNTFRTKSIESRIHRVMNVDLSV
jgi:hypothetical protein